MKRSLLIVCIAFLVAAASAWGAPPYMNLADLKPGMKGFVRTVLQGWKTEDIPVEVVSVLLKARASGDVVLVKLSGPRTAGIGVAQGMSGSPVYIEGKLVGALAFAWPFTKEPFAGITPVEQMTRVWPKDEKAVAEADVWTWEPRTRVPTEEMMSRFLKPAPAYPTVCPANMVAIKTPIAVSGFSKAAMEALSQSLGEFDVTVVQGGGAGLPPDVPADLKFEPGGALCVQLVRGDLDATGIGTVTEVVGDRFYGFGHPLFNNGRVNYMASTGYIHAVIPSSQISFKVGSAVKPVGSLWVDQTSAIAGKIGPIPDMLKVSLRVRRDDVVGDRDFNFEVTTDPRMMLAMLNGVMASALPVAGSPSPQSKVTLKAVLDIEGMKPLELEEVSGGPQAGADATTAWVGPLGYVVHNPFEKLRVNKLDIDVKVDTGDPRAVILSAETDKQEYHPGDEIDVRVRMQPYRGQPFTRHYKVKIPANAEEGPRTLMVCDAQTDRSMEQMENPRRFQPETAGELVDMLRAKHPRTDLCLRLSTRKQGLSLRGRDLGDLPESVTSVLGKQPEEVVSPLLSPIVRREPTEYVVVGREQVQINVVKEVSAK